MLLIPRQAQTSLQDFLNYLGTDNLTVYYQNELQYGQFNRQLINQFSDSHFQDVLDTISDKSKDTQSDWEIRKGNSLLLGNIQNQFDLAITPKRLQEGVKQGEFSLGQALTGYWLIEDKLTNFSQAHEPIPYYSTMKTSMDLLSTLESDNNLEFTNQQPSSTFSTANQRLNSKKPTISLPNSNEIFNEDFFSEQLDNNTKTSPKPIPSNQDNSSINWLDTEIYQPSSTQQPFQLNQSNFFQHQAFLHHLFSQLAKLQKLQYHQGKAIFTINDETLVAQLNEHNQWKYVSGTLSQNSFTQLQSQLQSLPSKSSNLTL